MKHRSFRTFAAAASIAAAGLGAAGTAAAAPLPLTEAAPIQESGSAEGTGSAALLPVLLPLLMSGSAETPAAAHTSDEAGTGSAATLLPALLPLLASGSAAGGE
ncbi:hypothetical protein [Nocardia sp. CA-290969]|uniref:hypothetical protein n=1 Tax=Nocardia sp. CA-290969 TaxID=3239986 RepID=UPI003D8B352C